MQRNIISEFMIINEQITDIIHYQQELKEQEIKRLASQLFKKARTEERQQQFVKILRALFGEQEADKILAQTIKQEEITLQAQDTQSTFKFKNPLLGASWKRHSDNKIISHSYKLISQQRCTQEQLWAEQIRREPETNHVFRKSLRASEEPPGTRLQRNLARPVQETPAKAGTECHRTKSEAKLAASPSLQFTHQRATPRHLSTDAEN